MDQKADTLLLQTKKKCLSIREQLIKPPVKLLSSHENSYRGLGVSTIVLNQRRIDYMLAREKYQSVLERHAILSCFIKHLFFNRTKWTRNVDKSYDMTSTHTNIFKHTVMSHNTVIMRRKRKKPPQTSSIF